jgi:DNA-binding transcriptional ArsR family regulator
MNMSSMALNPSERITDLLKALSQPARLKILLAIGTGEACVCHLEAALGQRQVYISQQLIALRNAGLVSDRREGRFIFYRLSDPSLIDLIHHASRLAGVSEEEISAFTPALVLFDCDCPNCASSLLTSAADQPISVGSIGLAGENELKPSPEKI